MKIEIFSDVACPWCFIGKRRFERALASFEHRDLVAVEWRSYQLDPSLPEHDERHEADYLAQVKGMPREQVDRMLEHVTGVARAEGLAYDFDRLVVANSWTAHRLIQRAKAHSARAADALEEQLFRAHFELGLDIGDEEVLEDLGVTAGLTGDQIREAWSQDRWDRAVREDLAAAQALGVTGVPFFVLDRRYGVSGAQPAEVFAQALRRAWDEYRPLQVVQPAAGSQDTGTGHAGPACGPEGCA